MNINDWDTFYKTYTYLQGKKICSILTGLGYVWMYDVEDQEPYVIYNQEQDVHILIEIVGSGRVYRPDSEGMVCTCETTTARLHTTLGYYIPIKIEENPDNGEYHVTVSEPVNNQ